MNHIPLVPQSLPPEDRVVVGVGRAPSGKQGMQTDGRAEGARDRHRALVSAQLQPSSTELVMHTRGIQGEI